ncbi:MAG: LytTR family DNA-binding domain-containing protein [Chitinophagaceae bacterium]|nr:LytTR family DNA-binding domain-containing protein [Chitinophagaceae bacterium]
MNYTCILVEDNILERDSLAMKINKINGLHLKACLENGLEALNYLKKNEVDMVISDIDMPDLSGLALIKSLTNPPVFILTSSFSEHAAESFELDVIDYIVKPVKIERLNKAVDKAIDYLISKNKQLQEPIIKSIVSSSTPTTSEVIRTIGAEEYVFIKENNTHIKLNMGDILYIESLGDFSKIYIVGGKSHMALISLKNLEKQLPSNLFMRVHKQYIVNTLHIKNISASDIRLSNNTLVPISISYKQSLQENLINKKSLTRFIE